MQSLQFDSYQIHIGEGLLSSNVLVNLCRKLNRRVVIMTDIALLDQYGRLLYNTLERQGVLAEICAFEAGEPNKTRETKQDLEDWLLQRQYGRDTCLVALGGGVVTDLVGFLAATYCRGIPVIYIPTTLLAMIDASMGGKTGVNTPLGKNLIGTFTQPCAIGIDSATLQTLPDREWRNGLVEMIKHSLIFDGIMFKQIQETKTLAAFKTRADLLALIQRNCEIKQSVVLQDEREHHTRQLLNFGHTIGHAIEVLEEFDIAHGEAVAIGLLVESYIAYLVGHLSAKDFNRIDALLRQYRLPLKTRAFVDLDIFVNTLSLDKKSIRSIPRFVLLKSIGEPYLNNKSCVHQVGEDQLEKALEWARFEFGHMLENV